VPQKYLKARNTEALFVIALKYILPTNTQAYFPETSMAKKEVLKVVRVSGFECSSSGGTICQRKQS